FAQASSAAAPSSREYIVRRLIADDSTSRPCHAGSLGVRALRDVALQRLGVRLQDVESLRQRLDAGEAFGARRVLAQRLYDGGVELGGQRRLEADHRVAGLAQPQRDLHAVGGV